MQPNVAPVPPFDVAAGVFDHDHRLDAFGLFDRRVDVSLERDFPASAKALVRGDDDLGFRVRDAARQRIGREAAEHDRMDRADARASEHCVSRLGNHGQVDRDAITLLDAVGFQDIGEMSDPIRELRIGNMLGFRGIVTFPNDRGLVRALGQVPIDAIVRNVGDAVLEPFDRDILSVE